jgi:hypothetical protein
LHQAPPGSHGSRLLQLRARMIGPVIWLASLLLCIGMNRREAAVTKVFLARTHHNIFGILAILTTALILGLLLKIHGDLKKRRAGFTPGENGQPE